MAVALGELQRNVRSHDYGDYRLTEIWVQLEAILDCRDTDFLGLSLDNLLNDRDYPPGQTVAAAAIDLGAEGILVPSATRLGDNLIIFPRLVRPSSVLAVVRSIDPHLIKDLTSP